MRSIPIVTKNLLIINVLAFIAYYVLYFRGVDLNNIFGLHFFLASKFGVYQFITYMFMHGGWMHLFFNMFALWMFGCVMEQVWGPKKFLFYYIFCGVGAGLIQEISQFVSFYTIMSSESSVSLTTLVSATLTDPSLAESLNGWTTVGASGAIYAILLAFGMTFPNERIFIFPLPIPIKAKWFVIGYVAIELFSALGSSGDDVAHFAHLGGMLFGYFLIRYWQRHPEDGRYGRSHGRQFFDRLRDGWESRKGKSYKGHTDVRNQTDWDYNADKKATEEKVDKILDKIRKNGYASLTEEEKRFLFESSNKK